MTKSVKTMTLSLLVVTGLAGAADPIDGPERTLGLELWSDLLGEHREFRDCGVRSCFLHDQASHCNTPLVHADQHIAEFQSGFERWSRIFVSQLHTNSVPRAIT